jgi:predicted dinucleotide-binding enzyme
MKITTIGRGSIGGTLARLWTAAGHQVNTLGRDGGDASEADVVLLAVRHADIPAALAGVTGLEGKTVIEASNRLDGETPHEGHASNAEYVKAVLGGPTAKAFNLNFAKLLEGAAQAPNRPDNIWVGDEAARAAVEQLTRDAGMRPRHAGPLDRAHTQEAFAALFVAIVNDADAGLLYYRFAPPEAI